MMLSDFKADLNPKLYYTLTCTQINNFKTCMPNGRFVSKSTKKQVLHLIYFQMVCVDDNLTNLYDFCLCYIFKNTYHNSAVLQEVFE